MDNGVLACTHTPAGCSMLHTATHQTLNLNHMYSNPERSAHIDPHNMRGTNAKQSVLAPSSAMAREYSS